MSKRRLTIMTIFCLTVLAAASQARAQEFRVEGAGLEASPSSYAGPCPGLITFRGKIQASGAGRVKYTYTYSDGGSGPEGFVDFEGPGVKNVETTWRLGDAATLPHFEGWAVLKVISPNAYESNKAGFVLDCKEGDGGQPQPPRGQPTPPSPNGGGPTGGPPVPQLPNGARPPTREDINRAVSGLFGIPGRPAGGAPPPAAARATFRVTLLGFVVKRQTRDTLLETDGKGDEVYQAPTVISCERGRPPERLAAGVSGPVHGERNDRTSVVQAGSAGDGGGLVTGDAYPRGRPWEGRTPARPGYGFPSVLFAGELVSGSRAAVIIPTLWEWDGEDVLFREHQSSVARALPAVCSNVARILASPELAPYEFTPRAPEALGFGTTVTLEERLVDMRDRPVGLARLASAPDRFSFEPRALVLTYEGAFHAAASDRGFGPGVVEVRYAEPPELEGSYALYLKVERAP